MTNTIGIIREVRAGDKTPAFDLSNEANVSALRAELVRVFPDAQRYLYPAVSFHGEPFAQRHCWADARTGENGCWLGSAQMAWTNDSWGWQSAEPSTVQKRVMRCTPCSLGGWFTFDVASIGD